MNNIFNKIYNSIFNSNYNIIEHIIIENCIEENVKEIANFLRYNESNLNIVYSVYFNPKTNEIRIKYKKVK